MSVNVVPTKDTELLQWLAQRQTPWGVNQAAVGLSQAELDLFRSTSEDANTAYQAWINARQAATDASKAWQSAKRAARSAASTGVKSIRNFASTQPDPQKVFGLALVPAPKVPNFGVPPGTPGSPRVELDVVTGALTVRFECNNPPGLTGTVYIAQRRSASATGAFGPWQQVAVSSTKRFVDNTIAAGTPAVQYMITAQRGSISGAPSVPFTIAFGRAGGAGNAGFALFEGDVALGKNGAPKLAA